MFSHYHQSSPFSLLIIVICCLSHLKSVPQTTDPTMVKRRVRSAIKRAGKKRSCVACHCRKVRCDMAIDGPPCSSCHFYDIPCVIPLDRRGKATKESKIKAGEEEFLRKVSNRADCSNVNHNLRFEGKHKRSQSPAKSECKLTQSRPDKDPQYWNQINERTAKSFDAIISSRIRPISWKSWLPDFAAPLSPSTSNDEGKVLHTQGVFNIPNAKTRAELLKSYVDFIHPVLPVLDLEEFLTGMDETYDRSQGVLGFGIIQRLYSVVQAEKTLIPTEFIQGKCDDGPCSRGWSSCHSSSRQK